MFVSEEGGVVVLVVSKPTLGSRLRARRGCGADCWLVKKNPASPGSYLQARGIALAGVSWAQAVVVIKTINKKYLYFKKTYLWLKDASGVVWARFYSRRPSEPSPCFQNVDTI